MNFACKRAIGCRLAAQVADVVAAESMSAKRIPFVALHGSLCAGEGFGENYDVDIALWTSVPDQEQVELIKQLGYLVAKANPEVSPFSDEQLEPLNGTGGLIGVRAHWKHEQLEHPTGIHAIRIIDVMLYELAIRDIVAQPTADIMDYGRFLQIEPFLRNYIIEAVVTRDINAIHERFRHLIRTYPRCICQLRRDRVKAAINALPQEIAWEEITEFLYSQLGLYHGNPKRMPKDLREKGLSTLVPLISHRERQIVPKLVRMLEQAPPEGGDSVGLPSVPTRHTISARCAIVDGDSMLMVKEETEGMLETPGGRLRRGETPADAARREVKEECGIDVELVAPISVVCQQEPRGLVVAILYEARYSGGKLTAGEDVSVCRWVSRAEVAKRLQDGLVDWHDREVVAWFLEGTSQGVR